MVEKESNRIRILFTIPNFDTAGSGKALMNIVTRLDKNIFEPHIACLHNKGNYFKVVKQSKIPIHIFDFISVMSNRLKGFVACWKIARKFKSINPDIIHSFNYSSDYSEALAAKIIGITWIYTKKNMNWGGKSKNSWKLRHFLSKHVIVQNTDMIREFFYNHKKVTLVPRGVDVTTFNMSNSPNTILNNYGIKSNNKILLTVANLVPVKGIEILIQAFDKIYENNKNICLFIVGENNNKYGRKLIEMVASLDSRDKIIFTGKLDNIVDYFKISDIFVLPTLNKGRKEGCPVALLEALASGIPSIGSSIPGIKDILSPFPEYLFEPGSVVSLIDKINYILAIDELDIVKNKFRNYIKNNYDINIEVKKHEEIYSRISLLK